MDGAPAHEDVQEDDPPDNDDMNDHEMEIPAEPLGPQRKKKEKKFSDSELAFLDGFFSSKMSREDLDAMMLAHQKRNKAAVDRVDENQDDGDGLLFPGRALVTRFLRYAQENSRKFGLVRFVR